MKKNLLLLFALLLNFVWAQPPVRNNLPALSQAQSLFDLGFYAGAENAFRQQQSTTITPQGTKGLLQSLIAQEKTIEARELLATSAASALTSDELALYQNTIALQEGNAWQTQEINDAGLDANERLWLIYLKGLKSFAEGDYPMAEAVWRNLPETFGGYYWAMGAMQSSPENSQILSKRLAKFRRQDWPIVKAELLGMLSRGEASQVRDFIKKNQSRLPRTEAGLIAAISYPANTPERTEALMQLLPSVQNDKLLTVVVSYCLRETAINLSDVEQQLGPKKGNPTAALILAQGWIQKGSLAHAYELLQQIKVESLPPQWLRAYYSTKASLAASQTPPLYRESANALIKLSQLPDVTTEEKALLQQQIADAYYKNADYTDAAGLYEKDVSLTGLQAVLAWLKADKPEEAVRVLKQDFGNWGDAMLAYLMYVRAHGEDLEAAYKPWTNKELEMDKRWGIEYLRIEALSAKDPNKALERLQELKDIPPQADYKVHFDLKKYNLLVQLNRNQEANVLLDGVLKGNPVPREFALVAIEKSLVEQRPEMAMEILPKVGNLSVSDRVNVMLIVAKQLGNTPEILAKVQKAIEALPTQERPDKMLILAQRWAGIGRLDKAQGIVEALQEAFMDGHYRDGADFLAAAISELKNDPICETELITLSQRDNKTVSLRAFVRLAAYYAQHGKPQEAQKIFYERLSPMMGQAFPAELKDVKDEILKGYAAIAPALPKSDADRIYDWVMDAGADVEIGAKG